SQEQYRAATTASPASCSTSDSTLPPPVSSTPQLEIQDLACPMVGFSLDNDALLPHFMHHHRPQHQNMYLTE
ncbi:hypothetical protein V490_09190, partial [Pseudogymnoascus sp. VKM F-3557]